MIPRACNRLQRVMKPALVVLAALLACGIPAPAASAESKPLVFVTEPRQVGMNGSNLGPLLGDRLAGLLSAKYPCADAMTPAVIAATLGWARDQQLLGTPEEQQIKVENIAGSLGRPGVLVTTTFGKAGDSYYVNVNVLDSRTGRMIASQSANSEGDDETLLDLLESLVDSLEIPSAQCRWTGAITTREVFTWNKERSFTVGSGPESTHVEERHSDNQIDEVTVSLLKAESSPSGESPALVTRTYKSNTEESAVRTGQINCAAGWNAMAMGTKDYRGWSDSHVSGTTSSGSATGDGVVVIYIDSSGHYQVQWQAPVLTLRVTTTISAREYPRSQCEAAEETNFADEFETTLDPRDSFAEGDVDPSNRDVLAGSHTSTEEMPDGESGQIKRTTTVRWYLERSGG